MSDIYRTLDARFSDLRDFVNDHINAEVDFGECEGLDRL